jgi:hypothetical protein
MGDAGPAEVSPRLAGESRSGPPRGEGLGASSPIKWELKRNRLGEDGVAQVVELSSIPSSAWF